MNGIVVIELLGVAQGLLLLLAWWRSSGQRGWTSRFLALLLGVASLLMGWMALHDSRRLADVPDLIGLGPALPFLFGPLLYGYLKASTHPAFRWCRTYWWHAVPFGLVVLGHLPFYLQPFAQKRAFIISHYTQPHLDWWGQLPLLHFLIYLVPVFRLISQHDNALKSGYSAIEARRLSWLRQLAIALVGCYGLFAGIYYVQGLHLAGFMLAFGLTGFVYLIAYQQLRQPALFGVEPGTESTQTTEAESVLTSTSEPSQSKYLKSPLSADKSRLYANQMEQLMSHRARYRDGKLTLRQVADELAVSPHTLSQVLSQTVGLSFYDYVNGYRVEAVKQALTDPRNRHLTILALAFEAGFESKAAFNNAFKKSTGLTPSAYRKQSINQQPKDKSFTTPR